MVFRKIRVGRISFSKKTSSPGTHFYLFLVVLCGSDLCFAFLFYSQPACTIMTSSQVKLQNFWRFFQIVKSLAGWLSAVCFDWTLFDLTTNFANTFLEGFFPKGKKTNEHQHRDYTELCLSHHFTNIITTKLLVLLLIWNQFLFTMKFNSVAS